MEEMEYEHEEMEEKEGHALSTLFKAANLAAGAYTVLRYFGPYIDTRAVLRWMGFARRRSLLSSAALFGAGALAGAGIAMFVSPMSGRQTRQGIARGFRNIGRKGREMLRSAGSQMSEGGGEQGGREQGGREQGGREGARAGEQRSGERQGEGAMAGARTSGQSGEANRPGGEAMAGGANRGEAGKALNR